MPKTRKKKTANHPEKRRTKVQDKLTAKFEEGSTHSHSALMNTETYNRLYAGLLKCRMMEESASAMLGRQKAAAKYKHAIGEEAAAVATIVALRPEDAVAPSDRGFVAEIVKGTPLKSVFARVLEPGRRGLSSQNRSDDVLHAVTPPTTVEAQMALAAGLGFGAKIEKKAKAVVAIFAQEWTDSDQLRAALVFAVDNRLPLVYVVQSNESLAKGGKQGTADNVATLAQTCGATVITVDGSDAVAVYRVASESISRARKGVGPTIIDCKFASAGEKRATDPLVHMESYMKKRDAWSDKWKERLVKQFTREIDTAVSHAKRVSGKDGRAAR